MPRGATNTEEPVTQVEYLLGLVREVLPRLDNGLEHASVALAPVKNRGQVWEQVPANQGLGPLKLDVRVKKRQKNIEIPAIEGVGKSAQELARSAARRSRELGDIRA